MLSALRRTKTRPAWALLIVALACFVTLTTLALRNWTSAKNASDDAGVPLRADGSVTARQDGNDVETLRRAGTTLGVGGSGAEGGRAASAVVVTSLPDIASPASLAGPIGGASDAVAAPPAAGAALTAGSGVTVAHALSGATPGATSGGTSGTRAAPHRKAVLDESAASRNLRADIARYNAERNSTAHRGHVEKLRAANVQDLHSLWDEMPAPLSNLYRN